MLSSLLIVGLPQACLGSFFISNVKGSTILLKSLINCLQQFIKPINMQILCTLVSNSQSQIILIYSRLTLTPLGETIYPRYSVQSIFYLHFKSFIYSLALYNLSSTLQMCSLCSSLELEKIRILSRFIIQVTLTNLTKALIIQTQI